ncbi:MAG TPA: cytochrome P450 [Acidimicrobiia bacterium]|nr:cytochrome P450 [Acidimicrobiia bacterium]
MSRVTDREIDLLDGDFYVSDPYPTYAWMREHAPVYWDAVNELWGISRYDDILEIEKAKEIFISSDREKGGYRPNLPADPGMIGTDDPLHTKRRKLVARRFTPKAVTSWEDHVRATVTDLLDAVEPSGEAEVVYELAAPLPAIMIGDLLGFPRELWPKLMEWSEGTILGGGGPRYSNEDVMNAAGEFFAACSELYEERSACPVDDIMSVWTQATIDGVPLGHGTVLSDCLLVLDGGAETTRTVIARTLLELAARPDQWQLLRDGADLAVATEEFIRWVTPIVNMCRVATRDYDLCGTTIRKGQQVVLMYPSANRDPEHFDDPDRFDVTRQPNQHLSFGFGTHFCLGAALARLEIRVFFEEFVRRVRDLRMKPETEVVEIPNAFVFGLKRANMEFDFA